DGHALVSAPEGAPQADLVDGANSARPMGRNQRNARRCGRAEQGSGRCAAAASQQGSPSGALRAQARLVRTPLGAKTSVEEFLRAPRRILAFVIQSWPRLPRIAMPRPIRSALAMIVSVKGAAPAEGNVLASAMYRFDAS